MNLKDNTILITGGSSGIGLELTKQLSANGNKVIICGRSLEKLQQAKEEYPDIEIIQCDLADKKQCDDLVNQIKAEFPSLNILVNNAAIVNKINFLETLNALHLAESEIAINFLAPLRLIKNLYDMIQQNPNPSIINITTGLVYVPRAEYPFYCSTKSALHSFTKILRKQTENDLVHIVEVLFPSVKTPWHKGNPPKIAITTEKAVTEMLCELEKGKSEIRVGGARLLYQISRFFPKLAFRKVNSIK